MFGPLWYTRMTPKWVQDLNLSFKKGINPKRNSKPDPTVEPEWFKMGSKYDPDLVQNGSHSKMWRSFNKAAKLLFGTLYIWEFLLFLAYPNITQNEFSKISNKKSKMVHSWPPKIFVRRTSCGALIFWGLGAKWVQFEIQNKIQNRFPNWSPELIQNEIQKLGSQFARIWAESDPFGDLFGIIFGFVS